MTKEEAIEYWNNHYEVGNTEQNEAVYMAISALEQEPKTGHWIKAKPWMLDNTSYKWECSECEKSGRFRHNFCPNCGADMRKLNKS